MITKRWVESQAFSLIVQGVELNFDKVQEEQGSFDEQEPFDEETSPNKEHTKKEAENPSKDKSKAKKEKEERYPMVKPQVYERKDSTSEGSKPKTKQTKNTRKKLVELVVEEKKDSYPSPNPSTSIPQSSFPISTSSLKSTIPPISALPPFIDISMDIMASIPTPFVTLITIDSSPYPTSLPTTPSSPMLNLWDPN